MNNWLETTLGKVAQVSTGYPFKSEFYSDDNQDIRLLRGDNISQGSMNWDDAKTWPITKSEDFKEYQLEEEDIVLAMDRPWIGAGLKYSKILKSDLPALLVQRTARLRGSDKLDSGYLKYVIGSPWFSSYIKRITTGSLVPHISLKQIREFPLSLPPVDEQKKVAKALGVLDKKIELNNSINTELEAISKILYDYWFVQFDFPDANGNPYKTSGGKMVHNPTLKREIPEGWEVRPITECCDIIDCLHSKKPNQELASPDYYLLQLENIRHDGLIDISNKYHVSFENYVKWVSRIEVKRHDVVMTNAGRIAAFAQIPAEVKCGIGRNITAIRPHDISPNYFFSSLSGLDIQRQILTNLDHGAFFKSFNVKGIKVLKIIRPTAIIEEKFDKLISPVIEKRQSLILENRNLRELRDWLLPMLMNGQVKVT